MSQNQISIAPALLTNVSYTIRANCLKPAIPRLNSANFYSTIALTIASGMNSHLAISDRFHAL